MPRAPRDLQPGFGYHVTVRFSRAYHPPATVVSAALLLLLACPGLAVPHAYQQQYAVALEHRGVTGAAPCMLSAACSSSASDNS